MSLIDLSILPLAVNADEPTEQDHVFLQEWQPNALFTLQKQKSLIACRELKGDILSRAEVAHVIANSAVFHGEDLWISEDLRNTAKELLRSLPEPTLDVVIEVLSRHIKVRFLETPHPNVNPSSGRVLPQVRKGPGTVLNAYESDRQMWKTFPGTARLLRWCIEHLRPQDYEGVWHLIIPPMMSLLDDHQAYYRLQGVEVVAELLQHVPTEHLRLTGVDGLLISSLRRNLVHLHTPLTPKLLRRSVQTLLRVIECTSPPNSQERFDQLSGLLGDGIIGSVWVYASKEAETIEATLAGLPDVIKALGIGSVRYLKALVPQVAHNLIPLDMQHASVSMQIASLLALEAIIEVCRPRIYEWRGHIIDGMGRCWVASVEQPSIQYRNSSSELQSALRRVSTALAKACPSVVEDEYKALLACDEKMFQDFLPPDLLFKKGSRSVLS